MNEEGFDSSESCGKCHAQIYDRWKESMHSRATSDPIFRASYMEAHYKSGGAAEKICLTCHSARTGLLVNPHPKDWGDIKNRLKNASNGKTCRKCH